MSATVEELTELLLLDVPEPEARRDGFLDVISQNTKENTINDVYQYFLSRVKSPVLSTPTLDALLELVEVGYTERGTNKELVFSDYEVFREYPSNEKGRIDLVIKERDNSAVVIIEVKVHHWLANNLNDYWNTFKHIEEERKAAVVLTLEPSAHVAEKNDNFINITHEQWLNQARNKGLPHNTPLEQIVYFNDFVDNMNHLTQSKMVTEDVLFYLNHAEKINKAIDTKEQAYKYLIDQLNTVASSFDRTLYGNSKVWRHIRHKQNKDSAYYAVLPEQILNDGGKVKVKLELYPKAILFKEQVWNLIRDDLAEYNLEKGSDGNRYYQHIASKTYEIEPEDFSRMTEILIAGIKKDLEPVRLKVMKFLEKHDAHLND